jgi:GNAT superfamily N-acetyltransferase
MAVARPATEDDLDDIAAVAQACDEDGLDTGANHAYCHFLLAHGQLVVAEHDHVVVAYAASVPVGSAWFLTDAYVHPQHRSEGTGRAVVEVALAGALDSFTFSSQDPRAMRRYVACRMRPHWPLLYLRGRPAAVERDPLRLAEVGPEEASRFERKVTGSARLALHDYLASRSGYEALLDGHVLAIVLEDPIHGARIDRMLWAADVDPVEAVLGTLATLADLDDIRLCLPGPNGALPALLDAGFRLADHDHYMASRAGIVDPTRCCPHPGLA